MVQISRFKLNDETLEKLFTLFFEVVGKKSNKDEFINTISDILSPVEKIMIAKRIAIIYLLLQNIDHRAICLTLKVSTATVAKFALLTSKSSGVIQTFNRILKNMKIELFLLEMFNALFPPGMPGVNWKSAWKRKLAVARKKSTGL